MKYTWKKNKVFGQLVIKSNMQVSNTALYGIFVWFFIVQFLHYEKYMFKCVQ